MTKRNGLLLAILVAGAFLMLNRGAYRGYFQADELDNLAWAPLVSMATYVTKIVSPLFDTQNFRPVGHLYFYATGRLFGLHFAPYVMVLHAIHLFNVWLLWLLVRRLGAPVLAAAAATVFYALHMALFDAVWKPMFVFDVLCATFCLLSLLSYSRGRWMLSLASFWLAYKSKELAVMLPLVLACYEFWFGQRRWKPLVPFFLISLSFGVQAMLHNSDPLSDYAFHFTPAALLRTAAFYPDRAFLVPYLGLALPLMALTARTRRTWFGLAMLAAIFIPLLFLPGRIFSAYCYVPFLGLAIAFSGVAERAHPAAIAAFFLLWTPVELRELRLQRRATLALDDQVREWVGTVDRYARTAPRPRALVYSGSIPGFGAWGLEGAVHYIYGDLKLPLKSIDDGGADLIRDERAPLLVWKPNARKLEIVESKTLSIHASFIQLDGTEPPADLLEGWHTLEDNYRWTAPHAAVRLNRPAGASQFSLRGEVTDDLLRAVGPVTVRLTVDGQPLEPRRLERSGWQTLQWPLKPAAAGFVLVTVESGPPFRPKGDARTLGIAVAALGFEP